MKKLRKISYKLISSRYIILILIIITVLLTAATLGIFSATRVQTENSPVKLVISESGAQRLNIGNTYPGNPRIETVILQNTGYRDGAVTIWISDIINSEGANPDSETGDTSEPGELGNYVLFNLSCERLETNMNLPILFRDFPQTVDSPLYVRISRLNAGESLALTWQTLIPPQTGNEVQGDTLSFTINYLLTEFPDNTDSYSSY
jgi:hypothetical protein